MTVIKPLRYSMKSSVVRNCFRPLNREILRLGCGILNYDPDEDSSLVDPRLATRISHVVV